MPKRSIDWNKRKTSDLFEAVLALKTQDECRRFFRDLCTLEEIAALADRWQMVKMMVQGYSYRDISAKLKVSTTTVARVAQWFTRGEEGYRLVVKRLGLTRLPEAKISSNHYHHASLH